MTQHVKLVIRELCGSRGAPRQLPIVLIAGSRGRGQKTLEEAALVMLSKK